MALMKQQRDHPRRRQDEAARRPYLPMRKTHIVFLMSVVVYLSICHLRSQNGQYLLSDRTNLVGVHLTPEDPPSGFFSTSSEGSSGGGGSAPVAIPSVTIPHDGRLQYYSHDPMVPEDKASTSRPVQVHFLTGSTASLSSQSRFLIEGVERSKYLKLVHLSFLEDSNAVKVLEVNQVDAKAPMIWMVDLWGIDQDCHALEALILHSKDFDKKQKKKPRILLVDYSGSPEPIPCNSKMNELMGGQKNWRIAQRGITRGRSWNSVRNWVNLGTVSPNPGTKLSGGAILHAPFPVREIVVSEVNNSVEKQKVSRGLSKLRPVDSNRGTDAMLFWRKGDNSYYGNLRREVATVVMSLQSVEVGERKLRTLVRFFGDLETLEQNLVYAKYVEEMMGTKVIVVAQRDEWEDHYRLMESLASGALVMTDVMVSLPEGLAHQKNIIMYDSSKSLRQLLLYYLHPENDRERVSIAKKGWELVMGHHRCWHRVEELIFGTALTAVDHAYETESPPRRERTKNNKLITKDPVELTDISIAYSETPVETAKEE